MSLSSDIKDAVKSVEEGDSDWIWDKLRDFETRALKLESEAERLRADMDLALEQRNYIAAALDPYLVAVSEVRARCTAVRECEDNAGPLFGRNMLEALDHILDKLPKDGP